MKLTRRTVAGRCPATKQPSWHVWWVTAHDAKWTRMEVYCNRCGGTAVTTYSYFRRVADRWRAFDTAVLDEM